ncbi:MAG: O-antigen ligase family protein, partial [Gaiellaceae bacterium]
TSPLPSRLAQGVLLSFVIVTCIADRRALRIALFAFVLGAAIAAVLGLAGVAGAVASTATASADVRVGGGLGDPNYLAAVLVPAIFCALGLHETVRSRALRVALLVTLAVLAVALLRTESRGGFIALLASAGAAVVLGGSLRRRILTSVGIVAVAGAVYFTLFASSASLHRLTGLGSSGGSGRTELWGVALKASGAHPLAGVGAGNFPVVEPGYAAATNANLTKPYLELDLGEVVHNTYLHLLAELGVVGLALFAALVLAALVLCLRACRTFARNGEHELETLTRGLLVGAVGMLVAFAFLTAQYEKQLWIVLALLVATHVVSRRQSRERCRAPTR